MTPKLHRRTRGLDLSRSLTLRGRGERLLSGYWSRDGWQGVAWCATTEPNRWQHPREALRRALVRRLAREALRWRSAGLDIYTFLQWSDCFATPEEFLQFRASGMNEALLCELLDRVHMRTVARGRDMCSLGSAALAWWKQGWCDPGTLAVAVVSGFEPTKYDDESAAEMLDLARLRCSLSEWA